MTHTIHLVFFNFNDNLEYLLLFLCFIGSLINPLKVEETLTALLPAFRCSVSSVPYFIVAFAVIICSLFLFLRKSVCQRILNVT
jgi:hypothetical protein